MQLFQTGTGTICCKYKDWLYLTFFTDNKNIEISIRFFKYYRVFHFTCPGSNHSAIRKIIW
jgi:hypothetical protein